VDCPICQAPACKKAYHTGCHSATCAWRRGVLLPAKVDQAAGHKCAVVRYERHLPDGHLSGRSRRVREVLARSETVGITGKLTNTSVQTARGVNSVEDPRVMLVRSLHGPPSPISLPVDVAAVTLCKRSSMVSCTFVSRICPESAFLFPQTCFKICMTTMTDFVVLVNWKMQLKKGLCPVA
jgi:hypothetical protein